MATNGNQGTPPSRDHKDILLKTLDDIVSVNSFLTVAVFVGLSLSSTNLHVPGIPPECLPGSGLARKVIVLEILSFAFLVCSSFIAKSMKIYVNIFHSEHPNDIRLKPRRAFFLSVSVLASTAGVGLLTASVALLVEIKVGKLFCDGHGTGDALTAFVLLCVLVGIGLISYLVTMVYAILHSMVEL